MLKERISRIFRHFCGHSLDDFTSFVSLTRLLHTPVDGASLGVGRMLFGLMMMIDIPEERSGGDLDYRWGNPRDCRFPLFNFLAPCSLPRMGIIYGVMWLGALGIFLGFKYRLSCLMFSLPYWYVFLLDKSSWNNHSYLYGLLGILFFFTSANRFCALDTTRRKEVPFWNYFLLKFQFFILYFLAGLKKLSTEWLSGYSMTNLGYHWVFAPFRVFLGADLTDLLIIHWFGFIFDLTIAFFLIWQRSRPLASLVAAAFHLMNSRLFTIGMFPWVCLVEMPLFYSFDWPRKILRKGSSEKKPQNVQKTVKEVTRKERSTARWILCYMALQFFLPYSHFITKGYNNWTEGLYGYSWDMMVHSWDTILISIKVTDKTNGHTLYLEPYAFSETDRWTKHADMAVQYAHCVHKNLIQGVAESQRTDIDPENVAIFFDIWCSMNKRFQQRVFDPRVDLLKADWSPFRETKWVLPLLSELTYLRPRMKEITEDVLSWSNFTDIMFIADYPGLQMENYISKDLDNVTITCLDGSIKVTSEDSQESVALLPQQSLPLSSGIFHSVRVMSETPACYMFIYQNRTMKHLTEEGSLPAEEERPLLPIVAEISHRLENFVKFCMHVGNSLLYEIYGVPMPMRI
ncbi:vitamin K-dependent gamma-carboxylase [Phlebotomus argentipes]|uniref:vitamin K-dependent gamma-carboxylase n=1 Tax=Phlebotomus argentipes TaxID=94469 RepID=UPI00289324E4|nr:vitamin K-dependent gamma-carboxylase [Phlebotomus argentipes]